MTPPPKVHDLDDIVPLSPAKLPNGMVKLPSSVGMKGEAPLKTDEALVRRLA